MSTNQPGELDPNPAWPDQSLLSAIGVTATPVAGVVGDAYAPSAAPISAAAVAPASAAALVQLRMILMLDMMSSPF